MLQQSDATARTLEQLPRMAAQQLALVADLTRLARTIDDITRADDPHNRWRKVHELLMQAFDESWGACGESILSGR